MILVHGFRGHAVKTWGSFPQLINSDPELSRWSVSAFGFPSSTLSLLRLPFTRLPRFRDRARELADHLRRFRADQYKSIVLVGHSLGGLVCIATLRQLERLGRDDPHAQAVLARVRGLATYGTPLLGSDRVPTLAAICSPDLRFLLARQRERQRLVTWLAKRLGREGLRITLPALGTWTRVRPVFLYSAIDRWVDVASASLIPDSRFVSQFSEHHTKLCKPSTREDPRYINLQRLLLLCTETVTMDEGATARGDTRPLPGIPEHEHDWVLVNLNLDPIPSCVDDQHRFDQLSYDAHISENGDYHGTYRRVGRRVAPGVTDYLQIQTGASKNVSWHRLNMCAVDNATGKTTKIFAEDDSHGYSKVSRLLLDAPVATDEKLDVTWTFTWPQCVADPENSDSINLRFFPQGVKHLRYQITWEQHVFPRVFGFRVYGVNGRNASPAVARPRPIVTTRHGATVAGYQLEIEDPKDEAYLVTWQLR